jgi:hypothetical protein
MEMQDDRTAEQKITHNWLIIGTDKFLSGWGKAENGVSIACWACEPKDRHKVLDWVNNRSDMKRVRESAGNYRPKGKGHCHIYVVTPEHPSL